MNYNYNNVYTFTTVPIFQWVWKFGKSDGPLSPPPVLHTCRCMLYWYSPITFNLAGHLNLAEKLIELIELTESPFPSYEQVGTKAVWIIHILLNAKLLVSLSNHLKSNHFPLLIVDVNCCNLLILNDSILPQIGQDYEKQLGDISKCCSIVQPENIAAYTYVSTVDQYSAYLSKTKRGKVWHGRRDWAPRKDVEFAERSTKIASSCWATRWHWL